jgi:hypothetical protein
MISRGSTRLAQRGAATILAVMFLVVSVSLMVVAALNMSGSDILDTALHNDAIEALFIAETGVEHATHYYASGTPCLDLAPIGPLNQGRGTFQVSAAHDTDFSGAALPASRCRIEVIGQVATLGAQRGIEAIIELSGGNLLANDNANFNEPEGAPGPPVGWDLAGGWDDTGGPGGDNRAAYVQKPTSGNVEVTTAGSFGLSGFTVTAPATLTMEFDFKVQSAGPTNQEMHLTFRLIDGDGNVYTHSSGEPYKSGNTGGYAAGSVDIAVTGSGDIEITTLEFDLMAKSGQPKDIWLDNLVLTDPDASSGTVGLVAWREPVQP